MCAAAVVCLVVSIGSLLGAGTAEDPPAKPAPIDYERDVVPLLKAKCIRCHMPKKAGGKLDMTTMAAMLKGGSSGPAIEPGKADKSLLIELIHFNEMPPKKTQPRVTKEELKLLKTWIDEGAKEGK